MQPFSPSPAKEEGAGRRVAGANCVTAPMGLAKDTTAPRLETTTWGMLNPGPERPVHQQPTGPGTEAEVGSGLLLTGLLLTEPGAGAGLSAGLLLTRHLQKG